MNPKAYSYIRFSSPQQAAGDSYNRQHRLTVAYCKEKGFDLVADADYTFFDKATSAFSGALLAADTELSRFLARVQDGSIPRGSILIVESLDRLSRQEPMQALPRFIDMLNNGIIIHTLHNRKVYEKDCNEFDLFQSIMEMSRSHRESKYKSERVREAWQGKQDDARSSGKPIGKTKPHWLDLVLDASGDPVGYTVNAKADIVRRIFQLTLDGYGKTIIARMLNNDGHPSFKGKTWGTSSVDQILQSPTVLGIYQPYKGKGKIRVPRGEPILNYYPAIIDKATFDRARATVSARYITGARRQSPRFQIWQGIAKCQLCQSRLHTFNKGKKGAQLGYMRCYNAKKGVCTAKQIRLDKSEVVFKEVLAKLNILALVQSSASSLNAQLDAVVGHLIGEREKLAEFKAAYKKRPSATVLDLIYEAEATVSTLEAQESDITAHLAADAVIDKADFFARLDLESYESRARASGILKRLNIEVHVDTAQLRFHVRKAGVPVFDLVDRGADGILAYPANDEFAGVIQQQDGTFTPMLTDHDHEEQEYENEGYDSRDNPLPGRD